MSPPRNDNETTTPCPTCRAPFTPVRRQTYCSSACRQAAWRARHHTPAPAIPVPTAATRRQITVYSCTECEQRFLGQQWCPDCQRPCRRIDTGGLCPHCDEPVAIMDLLDQHTPSPTDRGLSRENPTSTPEALHSGAEFHDDKWGQNT